MRIAGIIFIASGSELMKSAGPNMHRLLLGPEPVAGLNAKVPQGYTAISVKDISS